MLLYLVRHGQSEANVVTYDWPDPNLTPLGHEQAAELGRRFEGEGIDLIIASPMKRAVQTALPIQRQTGAPLEIWQYLGEFRSLEIAKLLGRQALQEMAPQASLPGDYPEVPWDWGRETLESTNERARKIVTDLRTRFAHTDQKIVMVSHGAFINFMLMALIGPAFDRVFAVEQHNCCINKIVIQPDRVRVHSINEVAHLTSVT